MKKVLFNILKLSVSLGLGILIIWLTVRKLSPEQIAEIRDSFAKADYAWLAVAPLIGIASNYFRTQRWRMMLQPLGATPGFWNTFFAVQAMYFANLLFPRLGEVMRCTILARYEKIPVERSLGTMVVERLLDVVLILLVGLLLIATEGKRMFDFASNNLQRGDVGPQPAGRAWWLIGFIVFFVGAWLILKKFRHHKWTKRIRNFFAGLWEGLLSIRNISNVPLFVFHTLMIWLCYWAMIYFSFYGLAETSGLSAMAGVGCLFFGGFAMAATQGGIGAYPLVIREMLLLYGISAGTGYAFGWLVWTVQTIAVIGGGVISFAILGLLNTNRTK